MSENDFTYLLPKPTGELADDVIVLFATSEVDWFDERPLDTKMTARLWQSLYAQIFSKIQGYIAGERCEVSIVLDPDIFQDDKYTVVFRIRAEVLRVSGNVKK